MFKGFLFKSVKWIIRKYFNDGLSPVFSTNKMEGRIIAWEWMFYDEEITDNNFN